MSIRAGTFTTTAAVLSMENQPWPYSVSVIPGSGDTMKIEFSTTSQAAETPASATWQSVATGVVATTNYPSIAKCTALRFTQTAGANIDKYEIVT